MKGKNKKTCVRNKGIFIRPISNCCDVDVSVLITVRDTVKNKIECLPSCNRLHVSCERYDE